ncbi:MAG: hypothetical protein RL685_7661 [Pseudomonadota bacterium]|jgi:hypothetical protein
MKHGVALARLLLIHALGVPLSWGCGARCLRDSDCEGGLVCSRDTCVLASRRGADAGPTSEGVAGSSSMSPSEEQVTRGGSSGRSTPPSGSAGGSATGGRENLDASVAADAGSNRN